MFPECLLCTRCQRSHREVNKLGSCPPGAHSPVRETDPEHQCRTFLAGEEDLEENRLEQRLSTSGKILEGLPEEVTLVAQSIRS